MIIKLKRIISCSSEHPDYPASNLLVYRSSLSWRTAKPGEMLATIIFEFEESCSITGVDIGNYRSCVVNVAASAADEPDNWIPIVNHQFLTHDDAADGKFKDQVQLFTKRELDPEILKIKFDRVKVTCMQSANTKTLFGLSFITLRTEVVVDMGLDKFGRFKLKEKEKDNLSAADLFREKYLKYIGNKKTDYKADLLNKIKGAGLNNFEKKQEENREPKKRPLLEKLETGNADEVFPKQVKRTPFGDIIPSPKDKKESPRTDKVSLEEKKKNSINSFSPLEDKPSTSGTKNQENNINRVHEDIEPKAKKLKCCESDDVACKVCNKLPKPKETPKKTVKKEKKKQKPFSELLEGTTFSLSGYVNPQRDAIRQKALQMGAKYIANPNTTSNKCTYLICAFKNTPKSNQLKGHTKIVTHSFIEDCFEHKKRYPWRHYAWNESEKRAPVSEDEVESIDPTQSVFDRDTDSDTN